MHRHAIAAAIACVLLAGSCTLGPSGAPLDGSPGGLPDAGATARSATQASFSVSPETIEPTAAAGPSPVEAVQAFYDWYLTGPTLAQVMARPDVTPTLAALVEAKEGLTDPFTCGVAPPASFTAVTSSLGGTTAIVSTIVSDGSGEAPGPPVTVVLSGGRWQLESIGCDA